MAHVPAIMRMKPRWIGSCLFQASTTKPPAHQNRYVGPQPDLLRGEARAIMTTKLALMAFSAENSCSNVHKYNKRCLIKLSSN
jgi:hypothetical protein